MNKSIKRVLHLVIAIASLGAGGRTLLADTIVFDPDGSGNSPTVNLNSFQFGAGNSLDRAALPFTVNTSFQLLFQGQLNSVITNNGTQVTPSGLNATSAVGAIAPYEITIVGSLTETVTNVNAGPPGRTLYHLASNQTAASFVEIYYDANQNANPLTGTGYNDGLIILRGVPLQTQANEGMLALTDPQPSPIPAFDQFTINNYPGVTSATGIGGTKLNVRVTGVNAAFFVAPGGGDAGRQVQVGDIISIDLSQALPFDKVNPSRLFVSAANTTGGAGPAPSATPAISTVNGSNGNDLQAQTLIAASIRAASPTPAPTATPTPSVSPTATPTPTATVSPTVTPTPSATISAPKVLISANKTQVKEGNDVIITFTFKGATTHSAITVNYSTAGTATLNTDYTLTGTANMVTIPANGTTATVTLHAITDTVSEPNGETVKIAIAPGTGYNVPTQTDAKRVVLTILDPSS